MLWIIGALINTLIGYFIGERRGRAYDGSILGFCLGPLGWLIVLVMADKRSKCPHCASPILAASATVCARCARDLRPAPKPVAQPLPPTRVYVAPRPAANQKPAITVEEQKALESFEVRLSR
jgi:DNA-directed RNA polymerase subunit RPC12/RpoP